MIGAIAGIMGAMTGAVVNQEWEKRYREASPDIQREMLESKRHAELLSAIRETNSRGCSHSGFASGFIWGSLLNQ